MTALDMLLRRLRMLVDRTALSRVSYREKIRLLQVSSRTGVPIDGVEHLEPAGFSSHPLPGAETVVVNLGGNSGRAVVILVNDRRHRVVIEEGESIIYNMPHGDFVKVKKDRSIHLKSELKVFMETPLVETSQDLLVGGNAHIKGTTQSDGSITTDADVSAGDISLRNHRTLGVRRGGEISDGPVA